MEWPATRDADLSGERKLLADEGTEPTETTPGELGLDPGESAQQSGDGALVANGREVVALAP